MPNAWPKISVLLATYNGGRFLKDQLESLAAQTYQPSELVVCDDGSTDHTLAILEDFAVGASFPVRVFKNTQRLGYKENFLNGVSYAHNMSASPSAIKTTCGCQKN